MHDAGCRRQRPMPGSGSNPPVGQWRVSTARKPFLQPTRRLSFKKLAEVSRFLEGGSLVLELSSCIVTLLLLEESAGCATSAIRNHRFVGLAKASAHRKSNANLKSFNLQ